MKNETSILSPITPTTQRMIRAIDYIEQHLTDDVRLTDVSSAACLSHYHFMRTFHATTGLTIGAYIRRRRLTRAADTLATTRNRIIDIAFDTGFESQAAFTRAFKENFGMPPSVFRHNPNDGHGRQPPLTPSHFTTNKKGHIMTPQFKDRDAFTIIGIGNDFMPFDSENIGKLWDRFLEQRLEIKAAEGALACGVCDGPKNTSTAPDQFHYTAGIVVTPDTDIPKNMERIAIPAGHYAVFTHKGLLKDFPKTVNYIWKDWLPHSGYRHANAPDFEEYDARWTGDHKDSAFDVYIPIQKNK